MSADYDISGFVGRWVLLPGTSVYEHGTAPVSGGYEIDRRGSGLYMKVYWTNPDGVDNEFGFEGVPDGKQRPFKVKDLVDQIKLECPSPRELTSRGYYQGELCMVAQRQLDERRVAMRVTQLVYLADGSRPANICVYRKHDEN